VTVVFVTRSLQEALILGDRVVALGPAPARVKDVVDVSGVTDPDSERFVRGRHQLRKLLADEIDGGRSL
jgi:NitT/TauT family transport system ATP-binding protein